MSLSDLKSRIFLEGGRPEDAGRATGSATILAGHYFSLRHYLDKVDGRSGPYTDERLRAGYREAVQTSARLLQDGEVLIEVLSGIDTGAAEMLRQARQMTNWFPGGVISLPANPAGLTAAEQAFTEELRINLDHCFTQEQAAAAFLATQGARRGMVYLTLQIDFMEEHRVNGISLARNVIRMFNLGDSHVDVLIAGIRTREQLLAALSLKPAAVAVNLKVLEDWAGSTDVDVVASSGVETPMVRSTESGSRNPVEIPHGAYPYAPAHLRNIPFDENLHLNRHWSQYSAQSEWTRERLEQTFAKYKSLGRS